MSDNPIKVGNFYPPQIKVAKTGKYKELTDETYNTQSVQTVVADFFNGTGNMTKVLDEDMHGISIVNGSETDDLTFTVNNVTRPVFAKKGSYSSIFKESFREISIAASGPYYVDLLQQIGAAASIVVPDPPDTTAPDNVTNVTFTATQNSATITWDASASQDTTGYEVWRAGALVTTVTDTTYNATGLTPQTQYTYTIKAKDGAGNVASGTSINVTTEAQPSDVTPPNNVTGLTPSNVTQTSATLTWQASTSPDVKDYRVYKDGALIATVTVLTYNVTGLTPETNYAITVKARDNANNEASGTSVNVKTAAPADTTAPILTITPNGGNFSSAQEVMMSTNEPGSAIYYTTNSNDPTESDTPYSTPITVSASTTLKARAKDAAGNWSTVQTAVFTITLPDTTNPDPVSGLTVGTPTITTIPLTWTLSPSGDVTKQEVAYSTDGSNFTVASASVNPSSTSYEITGLTAETLYTVRVVAIDGAGNRSEAVTVQATTTEQGILPVVSDTFNRADTNIIANSATTLGVTEVGGLTWTNVAVHFAYGIADNKAYLQFINNGGINFHRVPVIVPLNIKNYAVEMLLTTLDNADNKYAALHIRNIGIGESLYLRISKNEYTIQKFTSSTATQIKMGNATPANGDLIRVESYEDGRIRWYINGVMEYEVKESFGLGTSNKVGFGCDTVITKIDRFDVYELTELPEDTVPPAEVTNTSVNGITSTGMNVSWTQPLDKDYKQVEIYNGETLIATSSPDTKLRNINYSAALSGLTPSTNYTFTIKTRDWSGNLSSGVEVTRTTL